MESQEDNDAIQLDPTQEVSNEQSQIHSGPNNY